jgi:ferredoxin
MFYSRGECATLVLVRIKIDPDLCEGYGVCMQLKPEWFELGADVPAQVLVDRFDDSALREIKDVMAHCPRNAIKIVSDE